MRLGSGKLLERFLESVSLLLAKADSSPCEDARLTHEILDLSAEGVRLSYVAILIHLTLSEMRLDLGDILLLVFGDLSIVSVVSTSDKLIRVDSLFDHV